MSQLAKQRTEPSAGTDLCTQQRLLPVNNGRFAMWLFLSTEVMLFAGLFGSYIVLRAGLPTGVWPKNEWVHVDWVLGLVNTLVLTVSSVTAWQAARLSSKGQFGKARMALLVTLVLGGLFLLVKGYEYKSKIDLGILPRPGLRQIHDQADIYYLAAVKQTVDQKFAAEQSARRATDKASTADLSSEATEDDTGNSSLGRIRSGLVLWTENQLASLDDPAEQQQTLDLFAQQIYAIDGNPLAGQKNVIESDQVSSLMSTLSELNTNYESQNQRLTELNAQINDVTAERREISQRPDPKSDEDKEELQQVTAKLGELNKQTAELTQTVSQTRQQIIPLERRLEFLEQGVVEQGVNYHPDKHRLPIVIPGGGTWQNMYYLLTGMHALHVIGGLLVFALFLIPALTRATSALHNAVLYWHFVDVVWIIVFVVIYWQ